MKIDEVGTEKTGLVEAATTAKAVNTEQKPVENQNADDETMNMSSAKSQRSQEPEDENKNTTSSREIGDPEIKCEVPAADAETIAPATEKPLVPTTSKSSTHEKVDGREWGDSSLFVLSSDCESCPESMSADYQPDITGEVILMKEEGEVMSPRPGGENPVTPSKPGGEKDGRKEVDNEETDTQTITKDGTRGTPKVSENSLSTTGGGDELILTGGEKGGSEKPHAPNIWGEIEGSEKVQTPDITDITDGGDELDTSKIAKDGTSKIAKDYTSDTPDTTKDGTLDTSKITKDGTLSNHVGTVAKNVKLQEEIIQVDTVTLTKDGGRKSLESSAIMPRRKSLESSAIIPRFRFTYWTKYFF